MNAQQVQKLVEEQIGAEWATTNYHNVDLRRALVPPKKIKVIEYVVRSGKVKNRLQEVWLVLIEMPESKGGYRIVFNDESTMFGLASEDSSGEQPLALCGWYCDFMSAFHGM